MNFDFFNIDNLRGHKYTERWLKKNRPDVLLEYNLFVTNNILPSNISFSNSLWFYINSITNVPKCYCGNDLNFISIPKGYSKYCSNKCSGNSIETRDKYKATSIINHGKEFFSQTDTYKINVNKTNIEKYGVEWASQSDIVKENIKSSINKIYNCDYIFQNNEVKNKARKTKKEKYDNETYNNPSKIKNSLISKYENKLELEKFLEKQKATNKLLYGEEFANKNSLIKEKNILATKNSIKLKYGVENVFELEYIQDKAKKNALNTYKLNYPNLAFIDYDFNQKLHNISCDKCGSFQINSSLLYSRYRDNDINLICTNCNPINKPYSLLELEIYDYIKSIYYGTIKVSDKIILGGKHLDIYLPDINLAIEFDGLYWHSELFKVNNYHLNKTLECQKQGIQLIHIFEDEWLFKSDIVKSMLKNKLGLTENKIFGRKCIIKEVNIKESKIFLDNNHIQGNVGSTIKLGLYYNNELVSLMCFTFKNMNGEYDLVRFCNKINTNIIGGASKLFKYFIKTYKPTTVISFSDLRWSIGDLYNKLGFKLTKVIQPSYWYIINTERFHKFNFRKNRKFLKSLDNTKSEHQIMLDNKIYRIYDCGLKKWIFKL